MLDLRLTCFNMEVIAMISVYTFSIYRRLRALYELTCPAGKVSIKLSIEWLPYPSMLRNFKTQPSFSDSLYSYNFSYWRSDQDNK